MGASAGASAAVCIKMRSERRRPRGGGRHCQAPVHRGTGELGRRGLFLSRSMFPPLLRPSPQVTR